MMLVLFWTGTFAVVSLMTGTVVEQLVPTPAALNSSSPEALELEDQRIGVASAVAFLSGVMMVKKKKIVPVLFPSTESSSYICLTHQPVACVCVFSFACLVCSWASSPHTSPNRLLKRLPAPLRFTWLSHSCRTCLDYGFPVTQAPSRSSRFMTFYNLEI